MNWNEVTIFCRREALEAVSGVVMETGISSFVVEDPDEIMSFLEESRDTYDMVDEDLTDSVSAIEPNVKLYVTDDEEGLGLMHALTDRLAALGREMPDIYEGLRVEVNQVREEDWQYNWREFFRPFELGEKLYIAPAWDVKEIPGRITVTIDPGSSFGSGQHETTRMALDALSRHVKDGDRVADIGSGSGILSAAAALLGAKKVIAVDIDPNAVSATRECAELNGVSDKIDALCSSLADALSESPDIVVANIFAGPVCELAFQLKDILRPGALFICTGIIESRTGDVESALREAGYTITEKVNEGQWYLYTAEKNK